LKHNIQQKKLPMKAIKILIVLFSITMIFACKSDNKTEEKDSSISEEMQETKQPVKAVTGEMVNLPVDVFLKVYMEADYIDIIFEDLPFSMSQDNSKSIKQILSHLDKKPPAAISGQCPLFGQMLVQKEGNIILEGDMFHSEGCYYYVFKHQGKVYHNGMTPNGIQFFENMKKGSFN